MIESARLLPHNLSLPKLPFSAANPIPFDPYRNGAVLLPSPLPSSSACATVFTTLTCHSPLCCAVYHGGFILVTLNSFPS